MVHYSEDFIIIFVYISLTLYSQRHMLNKTIFNWIIVLSVLFHFIFLLKYFMIIACRQILSVWSIRRLPFLTIRNNHCLHFSLWNVIGPIFIISPKSIEITQNLTHFIRFALVQRIRVSVALYHLELQIRSNCGGLLH